MMLFSRSETSAGTYTISVRWQDVYLTLSPQLTPNVLAYSTEESMKVTVTVADIVGQYDDLS